MPKGHRYTLQKLKKNKGEASLRLTSYENICGGLLNFLTALHMSENNCYHAGNVDLGVKDKF